LGLAVFSRGPNLSKNNSSYKCPYTFDDLERLERAIGEGVREVEYADKKLVYRSLDDMLKTAHYMRVKLGIINSAGSRNGLFGGKRITMRPTKGLNDSCDSGNEHGEHERFDRNEDH